MPIPDEVRERIVALHESGVPGSAIARRTGQPRAVVNSAIRAHLRKQRREQMARRSK